MSQKSLNETDVTREISPLEILRKEAEKIKEETKGKLVVKIEEKSSANSKQDYPILYGYAFIICKKDSNDSTNSFELFQIAYDLSNEEIKIMMNGYTYKEIVENVVDRAVGNGIYKCKDILEYADMVRKILESKFVKRLMLEYLN